MTPRNDVQPATTGGAGPVTQPESPRAAQFKLAGMAALVLVVLVIALQAVTRFAADGYGHHPVVRIVVQGESIHVPERELETVGASLRGYLDERHKQTHADIERAIDARVDALFEPAFARIPDYVEWHYSLGASGMRLGTFLIRDLDSYTARSVQQRLLGGDGFEQELEAVTAELSQTLLARDEGLAASIEARVLQRFRAAQDDTDRQPPESAITHNVDLSSALTQALTAGDDDWARWQLTSGTAVAASGAAVAGRVVAASAVLRGVVARAGRSVAGMAARRAATAAPAAAGAGAAAAPTGPGALAVGAGVFVVGVVGGEYAFLELDRRRRGPAFERDLEAALELAREDLKATLRNHYQQAIQQAHAERLQRLDRGFQQDPATRAFRVLGQAD